MITETQLPDGRWRYEGDGSTEIVGTTEDGRYTHSVVHCGWAGIKVRLATDDAIARLFGAIK